LSSKSGKEKNRAARLICALTDAIAYSACIYQRLYTQTCSDQDEAVRGWKFDPAFGKDGKPVAKKIAVEVDFHL